MWLLMCIYIYIFFGIEALQSKYGVCLSQRKYCLGLLTDFGLTDCEKTGEKTKG